MPLGAASLQLCSEGQMGNFLRRNFKKMLNRSNEARFCVLFFISSEALPDFAGAISYLRRRQREGITGRSRGKGRAAAGAPRGAIYRRLAPLSRR